LARRPPVCYTHPQMGPTTQRTRRGSTDRPPRQRGRTTPEHSE